ncbi:hypothetical protein AB4238_21635 [Shewanella sp. 10N.286.45.A1]
MPRPRRTLISIEDPPPIITAVAVLFDAPFSAVMINTQVKT